MLLKPERTPEEKKRYFTILGATAQIALVCGILLDRLNIPNFDFLIGMLFGFSMVGNLAYLTIVVRADRSC
jgi:uncharacterized membrane protein AbrB (regulator of aidB expression)